MIGQRGVHANILQSRDQTCEFAAVVAVISELHSLDLFGTLHCHESVRQTRHCQMVDAYTVPGIQALLSTDKRPNLHRLSVQGAEEPLGDPSIR